MSVDLIQLFNRFLEFIRTYERILSPAIGVLVGLFIKEIADFVYRPRVSMEIDLSAMKPFSIVGTPDIGKYWRLRIKNSGKRPAQLCEAKFEAFDENHNSLFDPSILHWVRRYPALYTGSQVLQQFEPITINSKDHEFLDVIEVLSKDHQRNNGQHLVMHTISHRPFFFKPHTKYIFKVTMYSKNLNPISRKFCLEWNGTWQGFDENSICTCT